MSVLEKLPGFKEWHPLWGGDRWVYSFDHGWGASVVRHSYSYGGEEGLYELAVLHDGKLNYDHPVSGGDVRGYLDLEDVVELLTEIREHCPEVIRG